MKQTKKYPVKMNYRFNLDSMRTHVLNLLDDIRDGKFRTVKLMGEAMDEERLEAFKDELEELMSKAYYPVCGKDYARIKEISDTRNMIRYARCLSYGMHESDASSCFFD